jgi:hypothetical protein
MNRSILIIGLAGAFSFTAFGQMQKAQPDQDSYKPRHEAATPAKTEKSKKSGKSRSASDPAGAGSILEAGTNLEAQLQSVIDVRKSQVGDEVVLKTTKNIKQDGEVVVPKGTQLIGRITEVKQKTKDDAASKVSMVINQIKGKELNMPVDLSIVSLVTAGAAASAGDLFSSDLSGSAGSSASGRTSGGGGGLLGGSGGGGLLSTAGSTIGSTVNTATQTVGSTVGTATGVAGQTVGTVGRTVNGLQITNSMSGSAASSSTLSAQGKNVRVEKGTTFNLRVAGSAAEN